MNVSTVPHPPGQPNPLYNPMRTLLDKQEEVKRLRDAIKAVASKHRGLSKAQIVQKCVDAGLKETFKDLWHVFDSAPKSKTTIGPNPRSASLYGRVGDGASILDVGSGNCMKLRQTTGRVTIVASDPNLDTELAKTMTVKTEKLTAAEVLPRYDSVVTSFNALPQLSKAEISMIEERDGLHIIPDHQYLLDHGLAKPILVTEQDHLVQKIEVETPVKTFVDQPLKMEGFSVKEGFKLVATYEHRPINVNFPRDISDWIHDRRAVTGSYIPVIDASPANEVTMNWKDLGYKWDGIPLEFEFNEGKAYLTMRNGKTMYGTTDCPYHLCFHAEYLERPSVLVLIRVISFRSFIPPHCGPSLRQFVERHPLTVDGIKLYGPPVFDPAQRPMINGYEYNVDGIITRNNELDHYVKRIWTVDLTSSDVQYMIDHFGQKGVEVVVDNVRPGLSEYQLLRKDGRIELRDNNRPRHDKIKHTTLDTVKYLLELPTLDELVVLYRQLPEMRGYREYMI